MQVIGQTDGSAHAETLDADDGQKGIETAEVSCVAGVEGQAGGQCCGRDQQIDSTRSPRFAPSRKDRRVDDSVGPSSGAVERQRFESGLYALEPILASGSLGRVIRRVWPSRELGKGQGTYRQFAWELANIDLVQIDYDRGVDKTL